MATVATPVGSTGCDDILALYKGLVQATPGTRTLEMRVGEITISAAPAQQRRNKVAAKPPTSTSTREPPSRATTTSAQRRAVNRAAAHAGQPPPFPKKGATANPNADQELQHAPTRGASTEASARLSTAPQAPEAHPAQPPAAPPQPPAPPAASPPTQLNTLEPLHHPPPPPPHDALVLAARGALDTAMQVEGADGRGSTRWRGTPPPPARAQQPPQ